MKHLHHFIRGFLILCILAFFVVIIGIIIHYAKALGCCVLTVLVISYLIGWIFEPED
jgi:hypothetical protein